MILIARAFALILVLAGAGSAQTVAVGPEPDWVEAADPAAFDPALYRHIAEGMAFHFTDRQIRFAGGRRQTYSRIATEAVNRSALEAVASVARDFDPEIETLTLVRLDILRGGARLPMADRVAPQIFRREARLDAGIIDGTLTVHYDVPGLQTGDILDVAFLWDSAEYLPGSAGEIAYSTGYSVPVGTVRTIVHWPDSFPEPQISASPAGMRHLTRPEPGGTRHEWRLAGAPPIRPDSDTPPEYDPYGRLIVTPFADWNAVAATIRAYYTAPQPLPEAWRAAVEAIRADEPSDVPRAFAALRLVQDRIRYVGLEVGAGGYFARTPDEVVAKGFGDCKDKALLLKTVLEALGIEAEVALANLDAGYGVQAGLPRTGAFDHMIVAARLRGRWMFMDPTLTFQGGTGETAAEPDYGYVLPITEGPDDLVLIEANRRPQFSRKMTETFRFRPDGLYLDVETVTQARSADDEREAWATTSIGDIADTYLRYYQRFYPGIRALGDPVPSDQRRGNYFRVSERYFLPAEALHDEALYRDFPFVSDSVFGGYPEPPMADRRDPLRIAHRTRVEHNIVVIDGPIEFTAPDQEYVSGPAFYDRFTARASPGGGLRLRWVYETRARSVPAAQAARVVQDAEAAREFRAWYWDLGEDEVRRAPADGFFERLRRRLTAPAD